MSTAHFWPRKLRILNFTLLLTCMGVLLFVPVTADNGGAAAACVPGPHSGIITADQTWCLTHSPHIMTGTVTVVPGVTLTVQAGVTVKADSDVSLRVQGALFAVCSSSQPIFLTSNVDSGPYQWAGIAIDGGSAFLRHIVVRYAGQRNALTDAILGAHHLSALSARNAVVTLEHATLRDISSHGWFGGYDYGLMAFDSQIAITNTLFTSIGGGNYTEADVPVVLLGPQTTFSMSGNVLSGNLNDRILLWPGVMMGQTYPVLSAGAQMDGYEFRDDFTIPPTVTLTIEPGVTVMSGAWTNVHRDFVVEGRLIAQGSPAHPIVFTSVADSGPGQWNGLAFDGAAGGPAEGQLTHVIVRNAGGRNRVSDAILGAHNRSAISARGANLTLEQVTLRDTRTSSWDSGLLLSDSRASIDGSLFAGIGNGDKDNGVNADAALHVIGASSVLALGANQFVDNNPNMIKLAPGALTGSDFTLRHNEGLVGYLCQGDFVVPQNITMTIEPGVTYRGDLEDELRVEGRLVALGTPARPITFTSIADSTPNQWSGLVFEGTNGQGTGHLRHAVVRYAGRNNSVLDSYGHGGFKGSNITVRNVLSGAVEIESTVVERMHNFDGWHFWRDAGLFMDNSRVLLDGAVFRANGDRPDDDSAIRVQGSSTLLVRGSSIESNSGDGIQVVGDAAFVHVSGSRIVNNMAAGVRNDGAATVILSAAEGSANTIQGNASFGAAQIGAAGQILATHNWWGHTSGPTHAGNPGGSGEPVTDRVIYEPWSASPPAALPVSDRIVQVALPQRVSVGERVNIGVFFENVLTYTLQSAIAVLEIAPQSVYQFSSHGGQFWPLHNHVIWKLGDMAPGATFSAITQVEYKWGIPNNTILPVWGLAGAANLLNEDLTYTEHLHYVETSILHETPLSQAEVDAILSADPLLASLFSQAHAAGHTYYGNATRRWLNTGIEELELLLLHPSRPAEIVSVHRQGEQRFIRHESGEFIAYYDGEGGARFDLTTAGWSFWGNRVAGVCSASPAVAACPEHDWGDCLRNCLLNQIPRDMLDASRSSGSSCKACSSCTTDCRDICSQCARDMWKKHPSDEYSSCTRSCADSHNWNSQQCQEDRQECWKAPVNESKYSASEYKVVYKCDNATCSFAGTPTLYYCRYGCNHGDSAMGVDTSCKKLNCDDWTAVLDVHCTRAFTAKDPNALYGPLMASPGQTLYYTVETENEGAATAHDVFVLANLPAELDAETLQIGSGGIYFAGSRTLFWSIGELAAGAGSVVTFTVGLPASVISGTLLTAQAEVHFPSVPEVTPTNPVVTLVQDIAAHAATVTAAAGVPTPITLSGSTASGNPLVFTVTQTPWQGALAGAPPNLTYTADAGAAEQDTLRFSVSDGLQTSTPAAVTVLISPGHDGTPPAVIAVLPAPGASNVSSGPAPLYEDIYPPVIWAQFDEPLDAGSMTDSWAGLAGAGGAPIASRVFYTSDAYRLHLELLEPLTAGETYTVTLSSDIHDAAGNPLPAPYAWSFRVAPAVLADYWLYLPHIRR